MARSNKIRDRHVPVADVVPERSPAGRDLRAGDGESPLRQFWSTIVPVLRLLGSLKITVGLMALAICLVMIGTLAQKEQGISLVLGRYFRTWIATVDLQAFMAFSPGSVLQGRIYFPGGWLIGSMMAINLVAAHATRFKAQARGARLWTGLAVIVAGIGLTWLVIASGSNPDGFQVEMNLENAANLWMGMKSGLTLLWFLLGYLLLATDGSRRLQRYMLLAGDVLLGCLVAWLWFGGESTRLEPSSMRILWQLIRGEAAALVLLAGCIIAFKKRAAVVLLHGGIALIMFNEILVATAHVEGQMAIREGENTNFVQHIDALELAVIDRSRSGEEQVVAVPWDLLVKRDDQPTDQPFRHDQLPFDVQVVQFARNSSLVAAKSPDESPVNAGAHRQFVIRPDDLVSGIDDNVNFASAYVRFLDRDSGRSLGTYLFSQYLSQGEIAQTVTASVRAADDRKVPKPFQVFLRFARTYKPYSLTLHKFHADRYPGTSIARNYASELQLVDPQRGVDRPVAISMNKPLRYAGETFYQQNFVVNPETGKEDTTILQVVANVGWMIPYVGCMIVVTGMFAQFVATLSRFLSRQGAAPAAPKLGGKATIVDATIVDPAQSEPDRFAIETESRAPGRMRAKLPSVAVSACYAVACFAAVGAVFALLAIPPSFPENEPDLSQFGRLPVSFKGRIKPMDSMARNNLRIISGSESFKDTHGKRQPAIRWLMDVIAGMPDADAYKVFRIRDLDVLASLGLAQREGFRYSYDEIDPKGKAYTDQLARAVKRRSKKETLTRAEVKLLDLAEKKIQTYQKLRLAFQRPALPPIPSADSAKKDPRTARGQWIEFIELKAIETMRAQHGEFPMVIPNTSNLSHDDLMPFRLAWIYDAERVNMVGRDYEKVREPFARILAGHRALQLADERDRNDRWQALESTYRAYLPLLEAGPGPGPGVEHDEATMKFAEILDSYATARQAVDKANEAAGKLAESDGGDAELEEKAATLDEERIPLVETFGESVAAFSDLIDDTQVKGLDPKRLHFESIFNDISPFFAGAIGYVVAFVVVAFSWAGFRGPLRRTAFWLLVAMLVIHTFAIAGRVYISGRPPVTNLYSSAVFVGWGCVAFALVVELLFRFGIASAVASLIGFSTLMIAYGLAGDGDTITVMQAVLDTQFWLTFHVLCISAGYVGMFTAGVFGIARVVASFCGSSKTNVALCRDLSRIVYGIVCFAALFSFFGTVLGGLWADDSWGRFWGWDPKENGALMIVLWSALVLHARWGKIVGDRGLALLAVFGNVVTSWSWFGVNALGAGLHSYGFKEGVMLLLTIFWASQLLVIVAGLAAPDLRKSSEA